MGLKKEKVEVVPPKKRLHTMKEKFEKDNEAAEYPSTRKVHYSETRGPYCRAQQSSTG